MIALIDNNVILDAVARRQPFNREAELIFEAAGDDRFQGCITSNMATDIYYILRKLSNPVYARETLSHLFNLFTIITVTGKDCEDALLLPIDDYEDALLAFCAQKIQADLIVSRDTDFLKAPSPVPVMNPADFLVSI